MFSKAQKENIDETLHQLTIPAYGYELVRDTLLKDLLGKDYHPILYWGGKNLARKYPLESVDNIIDFFNMAGFGQLTVVKEGKFELLFELTSELITNRFERNMEYSYNLEAGFLAEQIQHIQGHDAEAVEEQKKKKKTVIITVKWD